MRLHELVRSLASEEIPAALEKVRQAAEDDEKNSSNAMDLIAALASRWAELDPRAALAYGWAWNDDDARKIFLRAAMSKWTEKDFPAASGWLLVQLRRDGSATSFTPLLHINRSGKSDSSRSARARAQYE